MVDFQDHLQNFFSKAAKGEIEIYNEFSLQHEIGHFLHKMVGSTFKTQFERPLSFLQVFPGWCSHTLTYPETDGGKR